MSEALEATIKKYSTQLAQDPKSRAFVPLADAYRALGRYDEAIGVAEEGLKNHPHYLGGKVALARAYFENGDAEKAQGLLENVLRTAPDNLLANRILVDIYLASGEASKALPVLKRILAMDPSDARAQEQLREAQSGPVESAPTMKPLSAPEVTVSPATPAVESTVLSAKPEPVSTTATAGIKTATLAEMYLSQGHVDQALGVYQDLVAKHPDHPQWSGRLREIQAMKKPAKKESGANAENKFIFLEKLLGQIRERRRAP